MNTNKVLNCYLLSIFKINWETRIKGSSKAVVEHGGAMLPKTWRLNLEAKQTQTVIPDPEQTLQFYSPIFTFTFFHAAHFITKLFIILKVRKMTMEEALLKIFIISSTLAPNRADHHGCNKITLAILKRPSPFSHVPLKNLLCTTDSIYFYIRRHSTNKWLTLPGGL